jgi:hypothetical protein
VKSLRDANLERLCILHCYDCLKYFAYMSEYAPMLHCCQGTLATFLWGFL